VSDTQNTPEVNADNAPVIATKRVIGRPFQKGNPGRPKGQGPGLRALLMKAIKDEVAGGPDGAEFLREYMRGFFSAAREPDTWQAKMLAMAIISPDIFERVDEWADRGELRERQFMSYCIHRRATDIQRSILFSQARAKFFMAGRRAGKSEALRFWFVEQIVSRPGSRCLYIGLTLTKAIGLLWQPVMELLNDLGVKVKEQSRLEGRIATEDGSLLAFGGNATKDEREKNRGPWWDAVAIDEAQSQKDMLYLIESIIAPTLIDRRGQLAVCGTGPRVRGTYWEALFMGQWADGRSLYPDALRLNWNLTQNPYIPDHETALEEIRREKNLKDTDPLYQREYLGRIAYDDDALVLRLGVDNAYNDEQLAAFIASVPVDDPRFTAGLDFGFTDSDAFAIILYSRSKRERFVVYEYKANRIGTAELAAEIKKGLQYVATSPLFAKIVNRDVTIYADTGGNAITPYDLATQYGLPIQSAYKAEKDMAVELLQDEVRRRALKVRQGSPLWEESLRTVYARTEQDALTREIDDDTYHPDMIPAVTYAMRDIWLFNQKEGGA